MVEKVLEIVSSTYDEIIESNEFDLQEFGCTKDLDEISPLLLEQKQLLLEYLQFSLTQKKNFSLDKCKTFYKNLDIPYIVIDYSIKTLKKEALKKILKEFKDENLLFTVEESFEYLLNSVAHLFIKKEIEKNKEIIFQSKFEKFPLYNVHTVWFKKIHHAIMHDDFKLFPHENAQQCAFSQMMEYPESLMVCMDATVCNQLELLHHIIHNNAEAFYRLLIQKKYAQAIFIVKEFNENIQKFLSLIKELYHLTYTDLENSFFQLVEILEYSDKEIFLSILDIQNLKQLNTQYGEQKIDEILQSLEEFLHKKLESDQANSLVIRAISANFYLVAINKQPDEYKKLIEAIYSDTENFLATNYPHIRLKINLATLMLDKKIKYQKSELIRLLSHLKEESKKEHRPIFVYEEEKQKSLQQWLHKEYYNIQFIDSKLQNEEVDVMLQPIYANDAKTVYAFEALARLKENGRLIPAGVFIDTIYNLNKINDLDRLVLKAILNKQEWLKSLGKKLFINTSPISLNDTNYLNALDRFIKVFGTQYLLIEITEQQAVDNFDTLIMLHQKYHIKFAIDDFGSGYSSLQTLLDMIKKGLIEVLKIDGSLIINLHNDENAQKIVKIIIEMCKIFHIRSLAEFIENKESVHILQNLQIDFLQGFYLSKPLYVEEVMVL